MASHQEQQGSALTSWLLDEMTYRLQLDRWGMLEGQAMQAIEIVERRGDGKWYTTRRSLDAAEYEAIRGWVMTNTSGRYRIRMVSPDAPLLSGSTNWQTQTQGETRGMQVLTEDKARLQGEQLAGALCKLFVLNSGVDAGAVYALARSLAAIGGMYDDADIRDAFYNGFLLGWQGGPRQITPPSNQQ